MSVARNEVRVMNVEKGTIGGATYTIHIFGTQGEKKVCFRKIHNQEGMRCTHPAGYRTDHIGTGACWVHGGAAKLPVIKTGANAVQTKKRLHSKIQEYVGKSREELLDLTTQMAATKAIFDEFIEEFPTADAENYGIWFGRFNALIATMGTLVDKISRIEARGTLTAAQVLYLRATMIDILMKFLPDPDVRERVVREIASRMGGDMALEMQPNEISRTQFVDGMFVEDDASLV